MRSAAAMFVAVLAAAGCRDGAPAATVDAATTLRFVDAGVAPDAIATPLAVDFTVSECPRFEAGPRCTGPAPLTLEFVPLGTDSVTKYLWDFGDGTKSSDATPTHSYAFPGSYDVSLVGGGVAGSAPRTHAGFVVVTANETGAACDVDQQCEAGLSCICGSKDKCTGAFVRGICASACAAGGCRPRESCADLGHAVTMPPEPWQTTLCLATCMTDDDCAAGLRCRDLPAPTMAAWTRGCFPGAAGDPGDSCRNAAGALRDDACVTGKCADLGTDGLCSLDCSKGPCPPGASCATLTDGRQLCLRRCGPGVPCDDDPLLACEPPNAGPLGFTAMGPTGATYCAPKTCTTNDDCAPAGLCRDDQNGAHCMRR